MAFLPDGSDATLTLSLTLTLALTLTLTLAQVGHAAFLPDGSDSAWTSAHRSELRARHYWKSPPDPCSGGGRVAPAWLGRRGGKADSRFDEQDARCATHTRHTREM